MRTNDKLKHRKKKKGYGFIYDDEMPEGDFVSKTIPKVSAVNWTSTGEYFDIADNHCAAVAVTNLALYFAERGTDLRPAGQSTRDIFTCVHKKVGNGPVVSIARKAVRFFKGCGYVLKTRLVRAGGIAEAVDRGHPCALLLCRALFDWHWVLCVGYRTYRDGTKYLQIVDGWHNSADRYYKPFGGSLLIAASEYELVQK